MRRLERLNHRRRRAALREKVLAQVLEGVSDGTAVVCISLLLFYLSHAGDRGLTVGEFVLFVTYLDRVADYAQWLMGMLVNVRRAKVSVGRLQQAMPRGAGAAELTRRDAVGAAERATDPGTSAPLQCLELRGGSYLHPPGDAGIRDIDLVLERGSFTVDRGPYRRRQEHAAQGAAGTAAAADRGVAVERRPHRAAGSFHDAAAGGLHRADPPAVQRHA